LIKKYAFISGHYSENMLKYGQLEEKGAGIDNRFRAFCKEHAYFSFTEAFEYFALLGGAPFAFDPLDSPHTIALHRIPENFDTFRLSIYPSYVLQKPYRDMLIAVAKGDGKRYAAMRKARMGERTGERIEEELSALGMLYTETSREAPLRQYPKQKIKKELRRYRIQDKLRFVSPFYRFWFGFVEPFASELEKGEAQRYRDYFQAHYERLYSLLFEQLADAFLCRYFHTRDPVISRGSYWNKENEFDILAVTQSGRLLLGECKYTSRPVCKSEFGKLRHKAAQAGIAVDTYVLFSKSGFSNELKATANNETLLLFDTEDMASLCYEEAGR